MKDAFLLVEASADMFIIAVVGDFVPVGRLLFDMLNIVSSVMLSVNKYSEVRWTYKCVNCYRRAKGNKLGSESESERRG